MYLFCEKSLKTEKQIIFEHTELGQLHKALPLSNLSELLPLKKHKSGAPGWVNNQGMIALLFLQAYTKLSDRHFIDHLNGNWQMQMFCGLQLAINDTIKDRNLMSRVRKHVSAYLDLEQYQRTLLDHWKPHMTNTHVGMSDATVYESHMRYPTDVKLLWECYEYLQSQWRNLCVRMNTKISDKQYSKQKRQYLDYARRRKKPYKLTAKMRKKLVGITEKLQHKLKDKLSTYLAQNNPKAFTAVFEKLRTIKQILVQQQYLIKHKGSKVEARILSLYKPYVRAIVRGKETKAVEFGAKVHVMQVDGINYIEHLNYNAFNETTRFKVSILKHKTLFGKCSHWSGDRIYATNKNRKHASGLKIQTNFVPKGFRTNDPQQKQMRALLDKERSTRLEGSFGVEKNYYGLSKVKARKEQTEKLCIYFAVMTANAVRIKARTESPPHQQAA